MPARRSVEVTERRRIVVDVAMEDQNDIPEAALRAAYEQDKRNWKVLSVDIDLDPLP